MNEVCQASEEQKAIVESLAERAEKIKNRRADSSDNMLLITNDGRKCALDQRLLNPLLPDAPGSKVNRCVENIYRIWRDTEGERSAQLVFCDLSTPKKGVFNVYDDVREKLVKKGIPKEEVAFIHEYEKRNRRRSFSRGYVPARCVS